MTDIAAPATDTSAEEDATANVARGGALSAIGAVASMILNFAIIVLVTRRYGAEGAGIFFTVIALFTVAGTTAKLGAETGLVFSVSRAMAQRREDDVVPTIRLALLPSLVFSLLLGAAAMAWSETLAEWLSDSASADRFAQVVRNVALLLPAYVAVHVLSGATRGLGMMRPTVYGINVGRPALQLVPMAAVAAAGLGVGALGIAWGIPLAITAIVMYWWLNHGLNERGIPRYVLRPSEGLSRDFWSYSAARGLANTLQNTQDRVGVLVVSAVATAATAGVFVAVARLIGALNMFTYAIGQALNPQLSALISLDDRSGANRLLQRVSAWTALPVVPVCLVLMVFPEAVLSIFGDDFQSGGVALTVLAGTTLVTSLLAHVDNVLLMGGKSHTSLVDVAASLAVTLGSLVVLVPAHGLLGAAIGWSLGLLTYSLLPLWQGWRLLGLHPFGPEAANLAMATVPSLAVAAGGRLLLGTTPTAAVLGSSFAMIAFAGLVYRRQYELGLPDLALMLRDRRGVI